MSVKWIFIAGVLAGLLANAGSLRAGEDYLAFLRALQQNGYGDMALEYLKQIERRADLPAVLKESLDLEYANCLWAAAASAYNDEEAQGFRAEAQTRLDRFIKEKPNHPALADAMATWGDMAFGRAMRALQSAKTTPEKEQKAALMAEARKALVESKPRFVKAEERLRALYKEKKAALVARAEKEKEAAAKKPGTKPRAAARRAIRWPEEEALSAVEGPWIDALAKLALIDYWTAQTYTAEKKAERTKHLESALKQFGQLYHQFRLERAGVVAHLWRAKVHHELGDKESAHDICEEVLSNVPEGASADLDPVFIDAELLWIKLLEEDGKISDAITEAGLWLKAHIAMQKTPQYQGVALALVKLQVAQLKDEKSTSKRRATQQLVIKSLTEIGKVRGEHQQEAILLKRELAKTMEGPSAQDAGTFEEALALANVSADNGRWEEAAGLYEKALTLLDKQKGAAKKKAESADEVKERLAYVRYQIASGFYTKKEIDKAFAAAEKVARDFPNSTSAPSAAALACYIARDLYTDVKLDAAKKGPALERLVRITDYTIEKWPGRPEADDARMALALASIDRGEFEKAIETFTGVNVKSSRYPKAMLLAGFETWRRYRTEKAKPEKSRDAKSMATWRANAEKWLKVSIEGQTAALASEKDKGEAASQLADTQALLAVVYMEGAQPAEAVKLYRPLVDKIVADKPEQLETSQMQLFAGAVRAYVALGDSTKAADVAIKLAQFAGDELAVNAVLIDAVKVLMGDLKSAEAAKITADDKNDQAASGAASEKVAAAKLTLARLLDPIAARKQFPPTVPIYLGTAALRAGKKAQAEEFFKRVVVQAEADKDFAAKNAETLLSVRAQLLGMLRDENKHAEALAQIDKLLEAHPKSLGLLMERGRILQDLAQKQPEKYKEAVVHWTRLREMLRKAKPKPPEYYEVIYFAAECLVHESKATKSPDRARIAATLLRTTLVNNPKLSGPDMVAKYNVLVKRAASIGSATARN